MSDFEHEYQRILDRIERSRNRQAAISEDSEEEAAPIDFLAFNETESRDELEEEVPFVAIENQEEIKLTKAGPPVDNELNTVRWTKPYTKEQIAIIRARQRKFWHDFYTELGLNPERGVPLTLHADDLLRFEMYNRRVRGNRLAGKGSGPLRAIPTDIFVYLWRNSVILARNNHQLVMLTRGDLAHGMKIDLSSITKGLSALLEIGLIRRVGRARKAYNSFAICYEIADIDEWYARNELIIPRNYKIRDRVSDIIWGDIPKRGKPKKVQQSIKEKVEGNPYWGLFVNDVELD